MAAAAAAVATMHSLLQAGAPTSPPRPSPRAQAATASKLNVVSGAKAPKAARRGQRLVSL